MNHLLRIRGWGRVRVVCDYPSAEGGKDARVEVTDGHGTVLLLTADGADELADEIEKAPAGPDGLVPVGALDAMQAAMVGRAGSVLRRAAFLARGERSEAAGPDRFRVAT